MAEATNATDRGMPKQAKVPYEPPVMRAHGALRDLTTTAFIRPSGQFDSDVNLKENIVAVNWAQGASRTARGLARWPSL